MYSIGYFFASACFHICVHFFAVLFKDFAIFPPSNRIHYFNPVYNRITNLALKVKRIYWP